MSRKELAPVWAVAEAYRNGQNDTEERIRDTLAKMSKNLSISEEMIIKMFIAEALSPFWNKDGLDESVNHICYFNEEDV